MFNVCLRNKDNNDCYDYGCSSKPTDQCGPVPHMDQSPDYFDCPESENTNLIQDIPSYGMLLVILTFLWTVGEQPT